MKVCFITPYPPEKDGVAVYTKRIIDNIPLPESAIMVLIRGQRTPSDGTYVKRVLSLSNIVKAFNTLRDFKPDIIHVQYSIPMYGLFSIPLLLLLLFMRRIYRVREVVTFHEVKRETDLLKSLGSVYFQIICFFFDHIIVHTNQAKDILENECYIKKPVSIIPLGSFVFSGEIASVKEIAKTFPLPSNPYILYFGYIHIDKGIEYAIEAFNMLLKKNPNWKKELSFLIVGSVRPRKGIFRYFGKLDHEYYERLKKLVEKYGLSRNIQFISYIPDTYVYTLIHQSKFLVLPYTNTEQSGVLHVAIAGEKPVIASNIGGMKETLEKVGILVSPRDSKAIADVMEELVLDNKKYRELVEKYKQLHKKLSIEAITREIVKLYKQVLIQK